MAAKNIKAKGTSGAKGGKSEAGKNEDQLLWIQGRHRTPYPEYHRAGLVFSRQPVEYTIKPGALDVLMDDPHLDVTLLDAPAADEVSSTGKAGPDQNAGGEGKGAGGTETGAPGADGSGADGSQAGGKSGSSSGAEGA